MSRCHFKRMRIVGVDLNTMRDIIRSVKARGGRFYNRQFVKAIDDSIKYNAFVEVGQRFLKVTTKYNGKVGTYVFDLCEGSLKEANRFASGGMKAYMRLIKFTNMEFIPRIVKEEDFDDDGKNRLPFSTSPFMYYNEKYNCTEQEAIGYDMNSAYSYAMVLPMPDTRNVKSVRYASYNAGIVYKGQIGFDMMGNLVKYGEFATYRFQEIESPFKQFVAYYYTKKKTAKTKAERDDAKDTLNLAVGYLQRINPFIRATIVSRANEFIKSLMDENTLYCNTDSIVSRVPRPDLIIGKRLGDFKIEHQGLFRYKDMNYQWNGELPAYRGVCKKWFKPDFNLLTDDIPPCGNKYSYDIIEAVIRKEE